MQTSNWIDTVVSWLEATWQTIPTILGAALLLAGGWVLARFLRRWSRRLVGLALGRLERVPSVGGAIEGTGLRETIPSVVAGFVFWVMLLLAFAAAIEWLGLTVVTNSVSRAAYYLPRVLAGIAIVFAGIIVANVARSAAVRAAESAQMAQAASVGRVVHTSVLVVAAVVALEQIGVSGQLLVVVVGVGTGCILGGASLAFGLGARTAVSNIIATHYLSMTYEGGQRIRIGDIEGTIIRTLPTGVLLDTPAGRALVPAKRFGEEVSILVTKEG